jgi:Zn-dependent M16 (insulinase) family peptidase
MTGLSVVHLDYDAPLVNGYFVVATEIFNDSGCPHTLEHLVFMGSKKFPYKGILDILANRGFSNGTNAWTDQDHTAYTISTAGEQGFLQLLPIYVDHILFPTITDAGFVTEVHHIDGKGHDSGVVYSEMQGRENTSSDLMTLRLQRLLDPPGSAYRSETGGLMEALRVLTADQIRQYHQTYYVPHNLTLIVTGKFSEDTASLLRVVQEQVEPTLIEHGAVHGPRPSGWKRPFLETASAKRPAISQTTKEVVEFPEKDETMGELIISFLGPPPNAFLERKALDILGAYLTSSAVAPLNKEYIETDSPLCSYIYFGEEARATQVNLPIYIGSVPAEHLDGFNERFKASLERIASDGIDMQRMSMVINRDERQLRSKLESAKGSTFSGTIITDFLYGAEDGSELKESMDEINQYADLRHWTGEQWVNLLRKYFIDPHSVVVVGKPSSSLADKLEADDKSRIADQVKRLGPDGLARAEKVFEEAKAEHARPIADEIIAQFPLPSVKSISWIPVQSIQEPGIGRTSHLPPSSTPLSKYVTSDGSPLPFFVQYDHVESSFVSIHAFLSLEKLPRRLKPLVSTYLISFFSLPVIRQSGERLNHEGVINKLDDETVSYDAGLGLSDTFSNIFRVSIRVEVAKYETAISWLRDLVYGSQFDQERLQVAVAKIQQALPELKRDGSNVLSSLCSQLLYSENSVPRSGGILSQMVFIPQLARRLQESPKEVIADMEEMRRHITDPSGVRFSVTGNVLALEKPRSTWQKYFQASLLEGPLAQVPLASATLSSVGKKPMKKAVVMSLPTIESSFVTHTTKGIAGFNHPEYPVLRVAVEVLNATESYLWRYIRGSGLAYGAYISMDVEAGLLSFSLYRSSNSVKAFEEAANMMKGLVEGKIELDATTLDAAKSSIVYGVTKNVSTPGRAAIVSFSNQALKNIAQSHQIDLLEKYEEVTKQDVLEAMRKHLFPLFDSSTSTAVVVTAPGKSEEIKQSLTQAGFEIIQRQVEVDPDELEGSDFTSGSEESQ